MSEYCFNLIFDKPSRKSAQAIERICKEEGGRGFIELNVSDHELTPKHQPRPRWPAIGEKKYPRSPKTTEQRPPIA